MTNKEIIEIIDKDFKPYVSKSVFSNDNETVKSPKIGNNQFRELANICKTAQCYEEIELLVEYNTAKAENAKSWKNEYNGKKLGDVVVECMRIIKSKSENDDKHILINLSQFFGYLYWNARVWSDESTDKGAKGKLGGGKQ